MHEMHGAVVVRLVDEYQIREIEICLGALDLEPYLINNLSIYPPFYAQFN